ncbi:MAG TPA: SprT family zinc-dependent metalloprotease [Vicinamibacterales bacterium]
MNREPGNPRTPEPANLPRAASAIIVVVVQLDLPFLRAPDPPAVEFVRMSRARRYVLRVRPDGRLRVTIPRGGSKAEGLRFIERHRAWIERERVRLAASPGSRVWTTGTEILLHGNRETIVVSPAGTTQVVAYGDRTIRIPNGIEDVRPFVERDLRELAREELAPRIHALAVCHGLTIGRITIRNQRSRWGSCSPGGNIALNYRLVQMPRQVCDYVLLHELMHIRQQNHSRKFWRLVAEVCPWFIDAENWLKTEGRLLL